MVSDDFGDLLPRHLMIIYEINRRFLEFVRKNYTTDNSIISELSIIRDQPDKKIEMSNLAIVGSHTSKRCCSFAYRNSKEEFFLIFINYSLKNL